MPDIDIQEKYVKYDFSDLSLKSRLKIVICILIKRSFAISGKLNLTRKS